MWRGAVGWDGGLREGGSGRFFSGWCGGHEVADLLEDDGEEECGGVVADGQLAMVVGG